MTKKGKRKEKRIGELMDLSISDERAKESFLKSFKKAFFDLTDRTRPDQLRGAFLRLNRILNAGVSLGYGEFEVFQLGIHIKGRGWDIRSPDTPFLVLFQTMRVIDNSGECRRLLWDALTVKGVPVEAFLPHYAESIEAYRVKGKGTGPRRESA